MPRPTISLITVAYNQANNTKRLIESFVGNFERDIHLFLHSRRPEVVRMCEQLSARLDVIYYPYGNNRGLAKSWNEGIKASRGDHIIIANNDIEFASGAVEEMVRIAKKHPEKYIVTCGHQFACFLLQPIGLKEIGYFDETFQPAYYEDCDYAYRARLAGLQSIDLPDLGVKHTGNGTIKNERKSYLKKYHHNMARLRAYYRSKWGGGPLMKPDKELYSIPFGGQIE